MCEISRNSVVNYALKDRESGLIGWCTGDGWSQDSRRGVMANEPVGRGLATEVTETLCPLWN